MRVSVGAGNSRIVGMELRHAALTALQTADPEEKCQLASVIRAQFASYSIAIDPIPEPPSLPGRPAQPRLVPPPEVPRRSPFTPEGRAALIHAVCHIEFNAINLALDAVWRFAGLPAEYYRDWVRVAAEEAEHFSLLRRHLQSLGHDYGDFAAHDGLWEMAEKTRNDPVARMALVPRTLEARGLDATPLIQARLRQVGTQDALEACALLDIILRDEVGHVAIGNRWYRWLCARDGLDPLAHYKGLARTHRAPRLKPPYNDAARRAAGFTEAELQALRDAG